MPFASSCRAVARSRVTFFIGRCRSTRTLSLKDRRDGLRIQLTHRRASTPKVKKARPQLRYRPLIPSWRMGRSTRLRTDFATQAAVATHRVHDKGAEIVCGFEREAVLAPFDCVCGVQLYRSSSRAFMSHSKVHRSALMYGGQPPVADRRVGIQKCRSRTTERPDDMVTFGAGCRAKGRLLASR